MGLLSRNKDKKTAAAATGAAVGTGSGPAQQVPPAYNGASSGGPLYDRYARNTKEEYYDGTPSGGDYYDGLPRNDSGSSGRGGYDRYENSGRSGSGSRGGSNDPYARSGGSSARGGSTRGGYDDDAARGELFAGRTGKTRGTSPTRTTRTEPPSYSRGRYDDDTGDRKDLFKGAPAEKPSRYDRYGERRRDEDDFGQTQEMDEEEEVEGIKSSIRYTKQESLATIQNSLAIGRRAEETASRSLLMLGEQSEKLAGSERHIDMASAHSDIAAEKTAELKALNRSIFRPAVGNPFTKQKKKEAYERQITARHEKEREERDQNRKFMYETQQRVGDAIEGRGKFKSSTSSQGGPPGRNLAQRARYQFEADSEDDELEDGIDQGLDELHGVAGRLKNLAIAMGDEVNVSNKKIDQLVNKTERVDTKLHLGTHKLSKIK